MKKTLFYLGLIVVTGCSFERADTVSLILQTDREQYEANETIKVTVRNVSTFDIYYSTCMPTRLEQIEGDEIKGVLGFPVCECICLAELKPNESWIHEVDLSWLNEIGLSTDLGSEYRILLSFYRDEAMGDLLEESELYTNRFVLQSE